MVMRGLKLKKLGRTGLLLWPIAVLLIGCASRGPAFEAAAPPSSEQALVYVYRPYTSFHIGNPDIPILYLDEQKMGRIAINGYLAIYVDVGAHSIDVKASVLGLPTYSLGQVRFDAAPGQTYYVRYTEQFANVVGVPGTWAVTSRSKLGPVSSDMGRIEIRATRRISQ